jgi:hypothetical protein
MLIIKSSRVLYRRLLPVVFGFQVVSMVLIEGYVSSLWAADDGHNGA